MKRAVLEQYLDGLTGATRTYPFGPDPLVFKVMNKMFAYVSEDEGVPLVTVKCVPLDGEILIEQFESITPGYHMNKRHWITISLTDEIPDDMLIDLANTSMPYGKYRGRPIIDLPEEYLLWVSRKGFPETKLGELLYWALEIQTQGLKDLITPLKKRSYATA